MLAAGFSVSSTASNNNNNVAHISQSGSQKATHASSNVHYSGSTASYIVPSIAATKENLEIAASIVKCLNAFLAGKIQPHGWSLNDLYQYHPDDVEEMDITWEMAMVAFRAQNVPFKLRCYNCHEPGHLARNCTKPSVNKEPNPAQPAPPNPERALVTTNDSSIVASESTQSSALVVQQSANFDWNDEIQRLNISAPENQNASENIAFMTSASEDRDSAPDDETPTENLALMTRILSAPVHGLTAEEVHSIFCTPECRERVEAYRLHNADLIQDYKDIKNKNFTLVKNETFYKEKIEAKEKISFG
ncbi:putative transcription factor interactor and regulator CCHC(Zn) family [Helianthus anomalus]